MTEEQRYENVSIKMSIEIPFKPAKGDIKVNFEGCEKYATYGNMMNICRHCINAKLCMIIREKLDELTSLLNEEVKE